MPKRKIQPILFAFGVTKKVKHKGKVVNVSLPVRAEEQILGNYLCSHCPKSFKNTQGLSVYVKCAYGHNVDKKSNQSNKLLVTSHKSRTD